jgi:SpoVK/Ycf46/Vps4 family AAA+-type ATPase
MAKEIIYIDQQPYTINNIEEVQNISIIKTYFDKSGVIKSHENEIDFIVSELPDYEDYLYTYIKITNINNKFRIYVPKSNNQLGTRSQVDMYTKYNYGNNNYFANWYIYFLDTEYNDSDILPITIKEPLPHNYPDTGKIKEMPLFKMHNSSELIEYVPNYENIYCKHSFLLKTIEKNRYKKNWLELESFLLEERNKHEILLNNKTTIKKTKHKLNTIITENNATFNELSELDSLNQLIGLNNVKKEIETLKSLAHLRKKKIDLGIPVSPTTLHMVFYGNPGTGKTSVARLIADIYFEIGLIKKAKVVEVSRKDLVEMYIGQTAKKVEKIFNSALGGVLFIDEAYSLYKKDNDKDFGNEAIDTLMKLMEDKKDEIVIIVAGYTIQMKEFLNSNPGLSSRFSTHIYFEDYTKDELLEIIIKMCNDLGHMFSKGAIYKLETIIEDGYEKGKFTSNARSIRNLFDVIQKNQSKRLAENSELTKEILSTFIDKDIPNDSNW